jgi:hypothetical protein
VPSQGNPMNGTSLCLDKTSGFCAKPSNPPNKTSLCPNKPLGLYFYRSILNIFLCPGQGNPLSTKCPNETYVYFIFLYKYCEFLCIHAKAILQTKILYATTKLLDFLLDQNIGTKLCRNKISAYYIAYVKAIIGKKLLCATIKLLDFFIEVF